MSWLELQSMNGVLHHKMCFIDFVHVSAFFEFLMIKQFLKSEKIHGNKLHNLFLNNCYDNSVMSHDAEKAIFNFPSHALTEPLLSKV